MSIKRIIGRLLFKLAKPCIIFESVPDFADNTRPVYDELVKRGYGKKYNLYWYINGETYACLLDGKPEYWKLRDYTSIKNRMRNYSFQKKKKALIVCNRFLVPWPICDSDKTFFLTHGSPIKDVRGYYTIPYKVDYCLIASKDIVDLTSFVYKYRRDRIIPLGYPRNDIFSYSPIDVKKILNTDADKVIVWYPTFKQHINGKNTGCRNALPLIYNQNSAIRINDYLRQNNVLIVLKPHFSQNLSYIKDLKLSNIRLINDEFYKKNNISSYQFLGGCDALLTDYSSVYYDFTLCDKPVGVIWEDIEEYLKNPGLVPDYEYFFQGAFKIYNTSELFKFISEIINGIDSLKTKREEIRDYFNYSTDGKNTERVIDFIIDKADL